MQHRTGLLLFAAVATVASIPLVGSASQAQTATFFCGMSDGIPATLAQTPRGNVEVIRWVSKHFSGSGYTPERRCQEVSARFQNHHVRKQLNFLITGRLNGLPAICVGERGSSCSSSSLLFTLKPRQNADQTLQQLFNIRAGASGPLYESTNRSATRTEPTVVDMNEFLETAPVVNTGSVAPNSIVRPPTNSSTGSSNNNPLW